MNALALALLALEVRTRNQAIEQVEKANNAYTGYLAAVVAEGGITDGNSLNSRADLYQALTMLFGAAMTNILVTLGAAYTAATIIGRNDIVDRMAALGHDVGEDLGTLGSTLTALQLDIQNSFARARAEIATNIRAAFDGVAGTDPADVKAARQLAVNAAVNRAVLRLRMRTLASVSTAVYQGSSDAQTAIFRNYANLHTYASIRKRWVVTSDKPCGMCRALDGTSVAVTDEFDRKANTGPEKLRPVYLDLLGPPRHPNCRCQLELEVS